SVLIQLRRDLNPILSNGLSLIIFPEGTCPKNGRLLPFKKADHQEWRKGSLHVRLVPLTVKYLLPIRTSDWTLEKLEDYVRLVQDVYAKNLPESQRSSVSSDLVGSYRTLSS
ncbi:hypothetical protein F511_11342, partial [Dorcoceras hygrometricum]